MHAEGVTNTKGVFTVYCACVINCHGQNGESAGVRQVVGMIWCSGVQNCAYA